MEKICGSCKRTLPISSFNKKLNSYQSKCKDCNKIYLKQHYKNNKKYYTNRQKRRREEYKKFLKDVKDQLVCAMCPEDEACCLDFHHKDPNKKEYAVSVMVGRGFSKENILKEIEKCTVVCSNCHRKIHAEIININN